MQLKIFFLLLCVVGMLRGAQKSDDDKEEIGGFFSHERLLVRFEVDDDKEGFCCSKNVSCKKKDLLFRECFNDANEISFAQAEREVFSLYGYIRGDWSQILDVVRQEQYIDVDYVGKRFVKRNTPVQKNPQARIERVILRIEAENKMVTKKDLLLMIYHEGYRDYSCRSILAKWQVLIGAGFCPKQKRLSLERLALINTYWNCVQHGAEDALQGVFNDVPSKDVDIVYQMIYMRKHGIVAALEKGIKNAKEDVCGEALERQNKILAYLKEREGQPCRLADIAYSVANDFLPKGLEFEIARLVFYGKAVVDYNVENKTCTLVSGGSLPPAQKGVCDEVVLFKNMREYSDNGTAILQTYLQGYRDYPPLKMCSFLDVFEVMHVGGVSGWDGEQALQNFLKKHESITPVRDGGIYMEGEWAELLEKFDHRSLDTIFEMHNRGTLDVVQKFAQSLFSPNAKLRVKRLLCTDKRFGLAALARFLRDGCQETKVNNWSLLLKTTQGFIQNIQYDIAKDEFSWIDEPEERTDITEIAEAKEACILRNSFPKMGVDCMTFVLQSKGFPISREAARTLFTALVVADVGPTSVGDTSDFTARCKECFAFRCGEESIYKTDEDIEIIFRKDSRVRQVVCKAQRLYDNASLKEVFRQTSMVQERSGAYYKYHRVPERRIKIFEESETLCAQLDMDLMPPKKRRKMPEPMVVYPVDEGENLEFLESFKRVKDRSCSGVEMLLSADFLIQKFGYEDAQKFANDC